MIKRFLLSLPFLLAVSPLYGQAANVLRELTYDELTSTICTSETLRDVYLTDSSSATSCTSGGEGNFYVRCSCVYDTDSSTYGWKYTADAIGASTSGEGGGTAISGTANRLAKFNGTGDNITDSSIVDSGSEVTISTPTLFLASNSSLGEESVFLSSRFFLSTESQFVIRDSSSNVYLSYALGSEFSLDLDGDDSAELLLAPSGLSVLGQGVCLEDGTNCPSSASGTLNTFPIYGEEGYVDSSLAETAIELTLSKPRLYTSEQPFILDIETGDSVDDFTFSKDRLSVGPALFLYQRLDDALALRYNLIRLLDASDIPFLEIERPTISFDPSGDQDFDIVFSEDSITIAGSEVLTASDGTFSADDLSDNTLSQLSDVSETGKASGHALFVLPDLSYGVRSIMESDISDLSHVPEASSVTSASIADGTIALADLADGTRGSLLTYDASGTPTLLSCQSNEIAYVDGLGDLSCTSIGSAPAVDIGGDGSDGPLNSIVLSGDEVGDPSATYDDGSGTLTLDLSRYLTTIPELSDPPDPVDSKVYYDTDLFDLCVFRGVGTGWIGAISGSACEIIRYQLSITKDGAGTGTITSAPSGIDCGGTCSFDFVENTVVTLTPTADSGSSFDAWSGDADCSDGEVTMSSAVSCTATFILSGGGGTAPDFASSLISSYRFESSGASLVSNDAATTCGASCDLVAFGTPGPAQSATAVEGSFSSLLDSSGSNNSRFGCQLTGSVCEPLRTLHSADFTIGGYIRPGVQGTNNATVIDTYDGGQSGIRLYRRLDNSLLVNYYLSGALSGSLTSDEIIHTPDIDTCSQDEWCHFAVVYEKDSDGVTAGDQPRMSLYLNALLVDQEDMPAILENTDTNKFFRVCGTSLTDKYNGNCDDIFVDDTAWPSTSVCRACRSLVSGEGGACNSSDPTIYDSQLYTCNSCTPSACNSTTP